MLATAVPRIVTNGGHSIDNRQLHVAVHYECLGLTPPKHDITKSITVTGATAVQEKVVQQRGLVQLECGKADYMERYMKAEIDGIRPSDHPDSVQIIWKMNEPCGFVVRGTSQCIEDARSKLKTYASEIRADAFEIDKRGMSQFLASPEGQLAISAIESKNHVVILPAQSGPGGEAAVVEHRGSAMGGEYRAGQEGAGNTTDQCYLLRSYILAHCSFKLTQFFKVT